MRRPALLQSMCFLALAWLPLHAQQTLHFSATVHAGEQYTHPIGHGLNFAVDEDANDGDWNFRISPLRSQVDYTACLRNVVMHDRDTNDLIAWQFAPASDAVWAKVSEANWAQHLPAKMQVFFITNSADNAYECKQQKHFVDAYNRVQHGENVLSYDIPDYKPRRVGTANVTVTSVTLKPEKRGMETEFLEVTLDVEIDFRLTRSRQ